MARPLSPFTLHRETVRLVLLSIVAVIAFSGTRLIAGRYREAQRRDAAVWHARGQQEAARGDRSAAAADYRRAMLLRPDEPSYALALAGVLAETGAYDAASRALLRLRERTPDDPIVNRALARVAAARHDINTAVRYYHNALYGVWPDASGPRQVRLELIHFLLANGATRRATSELIAATTDLPERADAHIELARLFAEAGDTQRAFDYFSSALHFDPENVAAVDGAIRAGFALGDYERVAAFRLPDGVDPDTRGRVMLAALVIANDPLGPRVGAAARRRRITALAARVRERAATCGSSGTPAEVASLIDAYNALGIDRHAAARDQDEAEHGLELLAGATQRLDAVCPPSSLDRAILLIAQRRGLEPS